MSKKLFFLSILGLSLSANAQTWVQDSAVMSPTYRNDVFYSMKNGFVKASGNLSWNLAFSLLHAAPPTDVLKSTTIRMNGGRGTEVYKVTNGAAADFLTFDTTNWKQFAKVYDSDKVWKEGGLNSTRGMSPFDFGWGDYKVATYNVLGDSCYIIKLGNGQVKKLIIDTLVYDSMFVFRYADLDNQNLKTVQLMKNNYNGKDFVYYSLGNDSIQDREPARTSWDILFTRYQTHIVAPGLDTFYSVMGVLANGGIECAKAKGVNTDTSWHWNSTFNKDINVIGWDWKNAPQGPPPATWTLVDSLAYFVKDASGDIYKLVFTKFGGALNGVSEFKKVKYTTNGIGFSQAEAPFSFGLFPNPANDFVNLVYSPNTKPAATTIRICNMNGKVLATTNFMPSTGLRQELINTSNFANGMYVISIESNGFNIQGRFIVAR